MLVSSHLLAELGQTVDAVVTIDRGRLPAQRSVCEIDDGGQPTTRSTRSTRTVALWMSALIVVICCCTASA